MGSFQFYRQVNSMDCGPACLRMVAKYYGRSISLDLLRERSKFGRTGVSLLGLAGAAESIGMKSMGVKITFDQLIEDVPLPAIVHWDQYHFVVVTPGARKNKVLIADPARGMVTLDKSEFTNHWGSPGEAGNMGIALLLEPMAQFTGPEDLKAIGSEGGLSFLLGYLREYKAYFLQILFGLLIGSMLQLVFPFLAQSVVDTGINTHNLTFIQIVLAAQLMLLFSQTMVDFIRSRLLLHVSTRINLSLLSGFWSKLLKLPISFFDTRQPGEIIQRIGDEKRIENFLTGTALNTTFSIFNLILFSFVLFSYNVVVFLIFAVSSALYILWIRFFLRQRRQLDYRRFDISAKESDATIQLIYGLQEIKLNNAENTFRWAWEGLQARLFRLTFRSLSLSQYQQIGAFFINQGKNILVTFFVARLVVDGHLTLGAMLAIQYVLGQLNSPIEQLIGFSQQAQDARISLERLADINLLQDEESPASNLAHFLPGEHSIHVSGLSFTYPGAGNEPVLRNIDLEIPQGKVTAIVGASGSGKTTLMKLLLSFYSNYNGNIFIGNRNFRSVSPKFWRSISGAVMQDSFIFNDTIIKNICVTDEKIDEERLLNACRTANILAFIESLPLSFYTRIGAEGTGLSGGQRQRLAIARAVYKNPHFLFFDEATNSLDANNEVVILSNLQEFFKNRTVLVVAHRLSTVRNADKIVIMDRGEVIETGTHSELISKRGKYYELVKNQLELAD